VDQSGETGQQPEVELDGSGPAEVRSWDSLPDRLADTARQAVAELRGGSPGVAVDLIDGMISELEAHRRTLADVVNAVD
jgi:hypothetical protein